MFGSFRRHQKWIWILGVLVIIPSFVIFFSPNASMRGSSNVYYSVVNGKPPTINGQPITADEFRTAHTEAVLFHFFRNNGTFPTGDEMSKESLERDTIVRVFMIRKLQELDIHVSDEAVGRLAIERLGNYPLATLEREKLLPNGLTLVDFDHFMRHE